MDVAVSPQKNPEELVETDKMIHVRMGNEDMIDLEELAGGKSVEIPEIEEKGRRPILELQIDTWIGKGIVDQVCAEHAFRTSFQ